MAIEPIYSVSLRPDLVTSRRQNAIADRAAGAPDTGADSANAAAPAIGQQRDLRLQEMMQTGRQTSALLSTLPGPNLSFFQAPTPPQAALLLQGPTAGAGSMVGGAAGPQRLNTQLLETEQTGNVSSALLSTLMGPNRRAFPAPTPPAFAGPNAAGVAAPGAQGAQTLAGAQTAQAPAVAQTAPGVQAAPGALPRAGAQLLETEQTGRVTSALLSGLMAPGQPEGSFGASLLSQPAAGMGNPAAEMRTAQEVIQAVGSAPPSTQTLRMANEAYQMENQAQRASTQGVAGGPGTWEWFA